MKHPVANITVDGEGHNPHAVVAEGASAFADRMVNDDHYLRDANGIPLTEAQRRDIAGKAFNMSVAFIEDARAEEATKGDTGTVQSPADSTPAGTVDHVVTEQDLKSNKELGKLVKLGTALSIPAAAEADPDKLKEALVAAATAAKEPKTES